MKVFHENLFQQHGLRTDFAEEFYSVSRKGVLRGLHYQAPPHDHAKLIYVTHGAVLDAVLDLRTNSPSFGQHLLMELNATQGDILYLPSGVAHGFYALTEQAMMVYKVTSIYSPEHDSGIMWDSAGISWTDTTPILSKRDCQFVTFSSFISPFTLFPNEVKTS